MSSAPQPPHLYGLLPGPVRLYENLYDPASCGWRSGPSGAIEYGSVELEVGRLWYAITMLLRPSVVLETGTFNGYSTACIASALLALGGRRRLVTIDPEPRDQIWKGTDLEGVITLIRMRSQDAAADLAGVRFDMLVLDSDHHYDTVMRELILYEPHLRTDGAILLHDSLFFDGVGAAVRQLLANPRFEGVTLDTPRHHEGHTARCPGATIVRKRRAGEPALDFDPRSAGIFVGNVHEPPLLRRVIVEPKMDTPEPARPDAGDRT